MDADEHGNEDAADEEEATGSDLDEDEDEEEPKLKYQRLGASVAEILKNDAANCMAVTDRFLMLGTHWGTVHLLDFNGNEVKKFACHTATVNALSVDGSGEYVASCSDDGRVVVNGLYSTEHNMQLVLTRPAKAVALDPLFSKKKERHIVTGGLGGELRLMEKGWFGGSKSTTLHSGEGAIHAIRWRSTFIAWANDLGVKIFDTSSQQRITYVDRPKGSPRPDLYRCHLCFRDDATLLIGWADSVKVALIKEKTRTARDIQQGLPSRYVEIVAMFQTDYWISGIAPYQSDLVILAYTSEDVQGGKGANRPELRIVTYTNEEISSDMLSIHGFESYQCNDYRLDLLMSERIFYIISPKDIVVARERDADDHLGWLLDRGMYEEAVEAAEKAVAQGETLRRHNIASIGQKYIAHLVEEGRYADAAAQCPKILGADADLWQTWVFAFEKMGQLQAIAPVIPTEKPRLSSTIYEVVLNHFLRTNYTEFRRLVREWPHDNLYDVQSIIYAVDERIQRDPQGSGLLQESLALLYEYDQKYDRALHVYLSLRRGDVFALINKHNLFAAIQDKIDLLMEFDAKEATAMLINNIDRVPVAQVVKKLRAHPKFLHTYLDCLFVKDPQAGSDFHELQVALYAEFDYPRLMPFLRQSNYYPLEKALKACEERGLIPEQVFLHGRIGNNKQALTLIIQKLADVQRAIEFAKEQNDEELWDDLLNYSMDKPDFILGLLNHVGGHIDPIRIIRRIPKGMVIPGLRDALVKILHDYNLQISLREGCEKILVSDSVALAERLNRLQRRGFAVDSTTACAIGGGSILAEGALSNAMIMVFFCGHVFFEHSLKQCIDATGGADAKAANRLSTSSSRRSTRAMSMMGEGEGMLDGRFYCPLCRNALDSKRRSRAPRR